MLREFLSDLGWALRDIRSWRREDVYALGAILLFFPLLWIAFAIRGDL